MSVPLVADIINFTRYDQYSVKYLSSRFLSKTVYVSGDVSIIHGQCGVSKYSFYQTQSNSSYQILSTLISWCATRGSKMSDNEQPNLQSSTCIDLLSQTDRLNSAKLNAFEQRIESTQRDLSQTQISAIQDK